MLNDFQAVRNLDLHFYLALFFVGMKNLEIMILLSEHQHIFFISKQIFSRSISFVFPYHSIASPKI